MIGLLSYDMGSCLMVLSCLAFLSMYSLRVLVLYLFMLGNKVVYVALVLGPGPKAQGPGPGPRAQPRSRADRRAGGRVGGQTGRAHGRADVVFFRCQSQKDAQ